MSQHYFQNVLHTQNVSSFLRVIGTHKHRWTFPYRFRPAAFTQKRRTGSCYVNKELFILVFSSFPGLHPTHNSDLVNIFSW